MTPVSSTQVQVCNLEYSVKVLVLSPDKVLRDPLQITCTFHPLSAFRPCEAAVCSRTAKPATTERGKPTTTSSSTGSFARSVARAGAEGTVKVSPAAVRKQTGPNINT